MSARVSVIALIVACAVFAAGCSGGKKASERNASANQPETTSSPLAAGSTHIESVGPDVKLDAAAQAAVLAAAQKYVDTAVYAPLQTGQLGAGYDALFETGLRAEATGADASTLTDTGIGKVDHYKETATPVAISGLADGSGKLLYLAASFRLDVEASTKAGDASSVRDVELTFAPQGNDWAVTGYRVKAKRALPGSTTTTTADAGAK